MLPMIMIGDAEVQVQFIRDGSGSMVAATSTFIPHLVDAPMAEAYALKEGLMLA